MNILEVITRRFFGLVRYGKAHKVLSVVVVVFLLGGGFYVYKKITSTTGETRYVLGAVERGTVISSVSASGQVSTLNKLDIKPKVSGEIISTNVVAGQKVAAGQIVAVIDPTAAQKTLRDARVNLESAQLSLEKLQRPSDSLSLIQAENSLSQATTNLTQAYDDGFNAVSDTFLELPTLMTGLDDILYGTKVNASGNQDNVDAYNDMVAQYASNVAVFKNDAVTKYQKARNAYDATFLKYRSLSRTSDAQTIEELIVATYDTTKIIADAVKSTNDFLGFVNDKITLRNLSVPAILTTHQNSLASYTSTTKSHLSSLLNIKDTITTSKYSIAEKKESLADLKAGSDAIDIKSAQLSLSQRQNALLDAQNTLADYYVRAPFAGTIAALSAKKYETAGSGTAIATLITSQQVAELSLNEVDAAKISLGDKASLTFDAIDGLTLTGQVVQIDTIGTVSQGVVSYAVKIGFDTQDERIKSGMTVNAAIQTDVRQDTLLVSSSAVKTQNGESYVQVFSPALSTTGGAQGVVSSVLPTQVPVTLGISDDTNVEVLSGVEEGAQVVVRTIFGTATTKPTTTGTTRSTGIGAPGGIRL